MKIIKVKSPQEGIEVSKKFLYEMVSKRSVLFLSGGSTPKTLYEILAKEKKLKTGAVALVDERFGEKLHENSNEKMIEDTGNQNIRFYPILEDKSFEQTTKDYDETVRYLFNYFPKSIGILGVGVDGHTAGIPAGVQSSSVRRAQDKAEKETDLVTSFNDFPAAQKERITLTFLGLSKLDQIIVLVFGKNKKKALRLVFKSGSVAQIPSRFLTQQAISDKVTLITDQTIK